VTHQFAQLLRECRVINWRVIQQNPHVVRRHLDSEWPGPADRLVRERIAPGASIRQFADLDRGSSIALVQRDERDLRHAIVLIRAIEDSCVAHKPHIQLQAAL